MFDRIRPQLAEMIRRRFSRHEKFGLHVTVGALAAILFMGLFYSIMEDIADREALFRSDYAVHTFFAMHRTALLTTLAIVFTTLGNFATVMFGMVCISLYLSVLKRWYQLSALVVSVAGGALAFSLVKLIIHRPRPPIFDALATEKTFSFPSGHSFTAFSFYAVLVWILYREGKNVWFRTAAVILGIVVILGIGLSRIYLGVHWPSDVLGGYASGAAWFAVLATALETWTDRPRTPLLGNRERHLLGVGLILAWLGFVVFSVHTFPLRTADHSGGYESPATLVRMEYMQSRQVA